MYLFCKKVFFIKINILLLLKFSYFLPLTLCFSFPLIQAPDTVWAKVYGGIAGDEGWSVQQTSDGGYIITGNTYPFDAHYTDVYLIKTKANGDTLWTRTYGGAYLDYGESVQETSDNGYIIAGWTGSFGAGRFDIYLIKTDVNGDTLWTRTYGGSGGDVGHSIQQIDDGGYIIAGATSSFGEGIPNFLNVYLIKINPNGDTLWTRVYGSIYPDIAYSVRQTSDGGYIIAGFKKFPFPGDWDVYLIKTDASGDTLWTKTYGGTDDDQGLSVQETSDSGYIVAGWTKSFSKAEPHFYLLKTDTNGDSLWTRTYCYGEGHSVQQTSDEGYIVVGWTCASVAGDRAVCLIRTNANGDTLWIRTYGYGVGRSIQQTANGGYIIAGAAEPFEGGRDVYLIKIGPDVE